MTTLDTFAERPQAARGSFPYPHRTVAEVDAAEREHIRHFEETRAHIALTSERPRRREVFIAPVCPDRTPCPRCGTRADLGCACSSAQRAA